MSDTRRVLAGGVSCEVAIVRDETGREIVVKQALPRLKVTADWRADPARSSVEVQALRVIGELLGAQTVPRILWEDAPNHRFAMERIDPRLRNWRDELNHRRVDLTTAARVGELLGLLHARSAQRADVAVRFANRVYFEQLRIEPFFRRIAARNPGIGESVDEIIAELRAPGSALVHGDFSPKNMLVAGAEVVILDCEPAHFGNPRFDLGFCLAHLILDGLHRPPAHEYLAAALHFMEAYATCDAPAVLDASLVRIIGALLLARLEGDSPIDYLADLDAPLVKAIALELIQHPLPDPRRALTQALFG